MSAPARALEGERAAEAWWEWGAGNGQLRPYTVGIEEEVMMLDPTTRALAFRIEAVLPRLPREMAAQASSETHGAAVEIRSGAYPAAGRAAAELGQLRERVAATLGELELRGAGAGTHPFAVWQESVVTHAERPEFVHDSMRELARREPTFALHVHVAVPDPEQATAIANRMRVHSPLLLALAANSPFWQGRDTGLASARTPLFQAFPRVGVPRAFRSYDEYVRIVDLLISSGAIPEPTFLWWDVRMQASLGTVEVRVMDTQTTVEETAALTALTQCLARLEGEERETPEHVIWMREVIEENRFLAARDGIDAKLVDPDTIGRIPLAEIVPSLVERCRPHAQDLGCEAELEAVLDLVRANGAVRQRERASGAGELPELVEWLADGFSRAPARTAPRSANGR